MTAPVRGGGSRPLAEDARFELARGCPQHAFQACAIGQLGESSGWAAPMLAEADGPGATAGQVGSTADPSCGAHPAELPQGRKAARAGRLWAGVRGVLRRPVHRRRAVSLALYRKYRPGSFAEVIGQAHVTGPLRQALRNGRISPRLPVQRPARLRQDLQRAHPGPLAELRAGPDARPVRHVRLAASRWPRTAPARSTSSRSTRPRTAASTTPATCASGPSSRRCPSRYKVYIIDEAHMVTTAAFNALLKLVEEPPEFVKFVFATTEPEKVLQTIRSRTHHYPFRLMPPQRADRAARARSSRPRASPSTRRCSRWSCGRRPARARDGLSILDQVLASAGPEGVTREGAAGAARRHPRHPARRHRRRLRRPRRRRGVRPARPGHGGRPRPAALRHRPARAAARPDRARRRAGRRRHRACSTAPTTSSSG